MKTRKLKQKDILCWWEETAQGAATEFMTAEWARMFHSFFTRLYENQVEGKGNEVFYVALTSCSYVRKYLHRYRMEHANDAFKPYIQIEGSRVKMSVSAIAGFHRFLKGVQPHAYKAYDWEWYHRQAVSAIRKEAKAAERSAG